jgi:hypothetical protein
LTNDNKHFMGCGNVWLMFHVFLSHIRSTH